MAKYLIRLEAGNMLVLEDGVRRPLGFITTRFVEAATEAAARDSAMRLVRDEYSRAVLNSEEEPYTLRVVEAAELETLGEHPVPGQGATWFPDEDEG